MTRSFLVLLLALSPCLAGADAFAQEIAPLVPSISDDAAKAAPKKSHHKSAATKPGKTQQSAEDAEKAARLEQGRKKFFERSMGFDNGGSDSPVTLQGGNGLTPAAGFKF